jgi:hypothetical protein
MCVVNPLIVGQSHATRNYLHSKFRDRRRNPADVRHLIDILVDTHIWVEWDSAFVILS